MHITLRNDYTSEGLKTAQKYKNQTKETLNVIVIKREQKPKYWQKQIKGLVHYNLLYEK